MSRRSGLVVLILRVLLAVVVLVALAGATVWWALRPGPALAVPPPDAVLEDVTLVEPGEPRRPRRTVHVVAGRIARIEPGSGGASKAPFAGRFVLPGLIDLHVHHPPSLAAGERALFAVLFLAHGVTSVRDAGSFGRDVFAHRDRIAAGELAGPRVFACGPFLDGDPPGWPGAVVVRDVDEARAAVEELAKAGADCVKVYNSLFPAVLAEIRRSASRLGVPVVAHVPWSATLRDLAGVEVQHLMGLADRRSDPPLNLRLRYVDTSRRLGISHTPTLVVFARAARLEDLDGLQGDPEARLLPRHYPELLWDPVKNPLVLDMVPGTPRELAHRLELMQDVVARLHRVGVPVLTGSDTMNPFVVPGASLHEELELLVQAGLTPEQAWDAASRAAGEALGVPDLGRLREGAPADLLVFREDPTRELAALATLEAVMAGGRLYPRSELEEAVRRQREHFAQPLRELVLGLVARTALAVLRGFQS